MSTIEELLVSYKNMNDQLAKNHELNEKIFREMTFNKIRKSFRWITIMDYTNAIFVPTSFFMFAHMIYKCSDNITMLILSIITSISAIISFYLFYKPLKFRFFVEKLLNEKSISESIQEINNYLEGLKSARLWSLIAMTPYFIFILPISWYVFHGWTMEGVYKWNLEHGTLIPLILRITILLVIGIFLVWKIFDWLYFPKLKKAIENLKEIDN